MQRRRFGAAVFGVLGGVVVLAFATGSFAKPLEADAAKTCKLGGIRYVGTTSQKKKLCFTLWKSGARISEYAYAFNDSCGSGTTRTTARNGILIAPNGTFSSTSSSQGFFKGRISGSTAKGTLRQKSTNYGTIPPTSCNSGIVRWSARRR